MAGKGGKEMCQLAEWLLKKRIHILYILNYVIKLNLFTSNYIFLLMHLGFLQRNNTYSSKKSYVIT